MENNKELLIKLDDFEGPLDLLLHLIKETKMAIQDVPMLLIANQYLEFIQSMTHMQLDIAGDYLVMAATLLEIKSRLLLPRIEVVDIDDVYEEDENIEELLIQQLIEYKQFKEIAQLMREKEHDRGQFFTKEASQLDEFQQSAPLKEGEVSFEDIIKAFEKMLQKQHNAQPIQAKIHLDDISVEDQMHVILQTVQHRDRVYLNEMIDSKSRLIASFLAMLELAKAQRILFFQNEQGIYLTKGNDKIDQNDAIVITSGV